MAPIAFAYALALCTTHYTRPRTSGGIRKTTGCGAGLAGSPSESTTRVAPQPHFMSTPSGPPPSARPVRQKSRKKSFGALRIATKRARCQLKGYIATKRLC